MTAAAMAGEPGSRIDPGYGLLSAPAAMGGLPFGFDSAQGQK